MKIQLLGAPVIHTANGTAPAFATAKAEGLFYYLVATKKAHTRSALANLFWRDMTEAKARVNLSKAISNLRQQFDEHLEITTKAVAFRDEQPHWLDVDTFLLQSDSQQRAPSTQGMEERAQLYRGDFLDGFHVRNAPEFEHWMLVERARLCGIAVKTYAALANHYQQRGADADAIQSWRRLLAIEHWREDAHYALMALLVRTGEPHAALKQFEQCSAALAAELDVGPSAETVRLYERIRANRIAEESGENPPAVINHAPTSAVSPPKALTPHNLSELPTEFVGREEEVAAILARLQEPTCRLLTLVGPGGIGKTRLALEVAHRLTRAESHPHLQDGVFFVFLMPVETTAGVIAAIADAIKFAFYSNVPPKQQLFNYLKEREILLILDNFEHLTEQAQLLAELLTTVPALKLVVTSRSAVPLQWTHFHPVRGLSYPPQNPSTDERIGHYDAMHLFDRLAQRHQVTFALNQNHPSVVRICQLVDGIPLALELAAAWLKVLPCHQIVEELEKSLDLLQVDLADIPERHRSMRVVFEQTWQTLTTAEQAVLQKLAVFKGGFTLFAAEQVAGAGLQQLAVLAGKVLILPDRFGRYQMHELLRQFVYEKLSSDNERESAVHAAHAAFFLHMLALQQPANGNKDPFTSLQADIDNIRTGWLWAVWNKDDAALNNAIDGLFELYDSRCRYSEGQELFAESLTIVQATHGDHESTSTLVNQLFARRVAFDYLLGQHHRSEERLHIALEMARAAGDQRECAFMLAILGQIGSWQSELSRATAYLQESLTLYQGLDDHLRAAHVHFMLAEAYSHAGHFHHGAIHARACVEIGGRLDRADLLGNGLCTLGFAYTCLGQYEQALENYRKGRRCFEKSGDRLGYALAIGGIGHALRVLDPNHLPEAIELTHQSLAICREIGHRLHTTTRLFVLGQAYTLNRQFKEAIAHAEECIQLAEEAGYQLVVIGGLWALIECYCTMGDFAAGRERVRQALQLSTASGITNHLSHITTSYAMMLEQIATQLDPPAAIANRVNTVTLATAALSHPAWHVSHQNAEQLLERQQGILSNDQFFDAQAKAQTETLETLLFQLLH